MNNRIIFLFITIAVIIIIIVLVIIGILSRSNPNSIVGPGGNLRLLGTTPTQDTSVKYNPVAQISFTFNEPIAPGKFYYKVSPNVGTFLTVPQGGNTIIVSPKASWLTGTTTITISGNTTAVSGDTLGTDSVYSLAILSPKDLNPPPDAREPLPYDFSKFQTQPQ